MTPKWAAENQDKMRLYRREHYYRNREHYIEMAKAYKESHRTKVCNTCKVEKPADQFKTIVSGGRRYLRFECKACQYSRDERGPSADARHKRRRETVNGKARVSRLDPEQRPIWIVSDAKCWDKKHGFVCDLDLPFVTDLISLGCSYCGSVDRLITLDRIDNKKGHTKDNVKAGCYLCNQVRRDMPYEAWIVVAESIRKAEQRGLFGSWMSKAFSRKTTESEASG